MLQTTSISHTAGDHLNGYLKEQKSTEDQRASRSLPDPLGNCYWDSCQYSRVFWEPWCSIPVVSIGNPGRFWNLENFTTLCSLRRHSSWTISLDWEEEVERWMNVRQCHCLRQDLCPTLPHLLRDLRRVVGDRLSQMYAYKCAAFHCW